MAESRASLPPGTRLGAYRIVRTIGQGGFSLIYLATDLDTGAEVVIKEYMPKVLAARTDAGAVVPADPEQTIPLLRGRTLFFREVAALAALRHPNIVRVLGFFLANGTGYLVMPNEPGRNLGEYLHRRQGNLSTTFILEVFIPILDALALLHRSAMLHLDVKPGNIHLRHGQQPLLLDLGAVRSLEAARRHGCTVITAGYSPLEQYTRTGRIGPWTDVYAVGASILACLTGQPPPPAPERQLQDRLISARQSLGHRYPNFLLEAVDWSLRMEPEQRPRDAAAMLALLAPQRTDYPQAPPRDAPDSPNVPLT